MTTNHTPTPWHAAGVTVYAPAGHTARATVADTTCCGSMTRAEDEANAAHIVRCVNAHDELVAALRVIAGCEASEIANPEKGLRVCANIARAALAKAGAL